MSGHSKWSTIKRKKESEDQKRGAVFTKLGKSIAIAVQKGGSPDPEANFSLRLAIDRAKTANMPKGNIQRAIDRAAGTGGGGGNFKEVIYEGLGPGKIAVVVEALTDNTNRTVSELKKIFEKEGGQLTSPGAVTYLFDNKGLLVVNQGPDPQETMLRLIDLGVEDVKADAKGIEVSVPADQLNQFKKKLTAAGFKVQDMQLVKIPKTTVTAKNKQKEEKIVLFLETVADHDDVQNVWSNFEQGD